MAFTISLIYGSVRENRQGIKAAKYLEKKLIERGVRVHLIDPLEYKLPLLDKMYKEFKPGRAPEYMEILSGLLKESDGFLVLTGEYNHSLPPALKNLLDHFQKEYHYKPSAIASYSGGIFGGVRAAVHLRVILGELGTPSIPSMLPFPKVWDLFDDQYNTNNEIVEQSTSRFLEEFLWYMEALKRQREPAICY